MTLQIIEDAKKLLEGKNKKIVLPEGIEPRILEAAEKLHKEGTIEVVLLGNVEKVNIVAKEKGIDIEGIDIIDPETDERHAKYVDEFIHLRRGKTTKEQAEELMKNVNYFGTMMVQLGEADGMVSGAIHTTGETVRPALQIIKTKPGITRTSGCMIMLGNNGEKYIFADVAINPTLNAQEMAEVTISSIESAHTFGLDPKVALLSFSTKGSAKTPDTEKVVEATKIAQEMARTLDLNAAIDGELQFDAAISQTVADLKAPGSDVAGKANVFIFPSLETGNIGYKIAQRLGGMMAVGPILQGLNKPVNDLSRGCVAEDVYMTALLTASQSL